MPGLTPRLSLLVVGDEVLETGNVRNWQKDAISAGAQQKS